MLVPPVVDGASG
jgi:hypothetical protein